MGFGLAIAHSVIKKHNGSIKVESIPGKGTTVSMLIPASAQEGRRDSGELGPMSSSPGNGYW